MTNSTQAYGLFLIGPTDAQALKLITVLTASATIVLLMLHLHYDYAAYLTLGPGGTPSTFRGFIRVKLLGCFAIKDRFRPATLPIGQGEGYLTHINWREGPRPITRGIAPHRQVEQKASKALFEKLAARIERLPSTSEGLILGTSCFEKHGTGLFSTLPAKQTCKGEVCHAHASDGSMHITLHPADAKILLEAGRGERHPLSRGGWFERFVPGGFVMVYAPRDEAEIDIVMEFVKAAAWFVGGEGSSTEASKWERRDSGYISSDEVRS